MPTDKDLASNLLVTSAAAVIVIAGIKSAADMLVPFLLAIFIAVASAPLLHWLKRKGIPDGLSIISLMLLLLAGGALLTLFLGGTINSFYDAMPEYEAKLQALTRQTTDWLESIGVNVPANLVSEYVNPGVVMGMVGKIFNGLSGVLANAFLILFTVIFILMEAAGMPAKMKAAFGEHTNALQHFEQFANLVQRYLAIKTLVSFGTGLVIGLVLTIMGLDYAPMWALVAFLLNYIPNIGSIIAAVPAVLIALIQLGPGFAVATIITYVVTNTLFGNVIEPRMMGRTLGLSTLVVFISLVFWGWVLGPVGMLLSIPLTMVVKIALDTGEDTRWMARLLDH